MKQDVVIIGGGPAGLAAALSAADAGIEKVLILERDKELGGILNQCIHNGFGLHTFKEELTGTEYAARYEKRVKEEQLPYLLDTIVIDISLMETGEKLVTAMNREKGLFQIETQAVVLAMGCRERSRGALNIPGMRPAGIYSAGTAQWYVNREGRMPGKEVVILGSGDIGLIMARRMTLEGANVKVVAELMPYSGGLKRNIAQCLDDFDIPLKLSHTVIDIHGKERVTAVTLAQVDENLKPIPGTEEYIPCDTLLLSCGLIPENELSDGLGVTLNPKTSGPVVNEYLETNIPGVFACGNVLHVHELVDHVSLEAAVAGTNAASFVQKRDMKSVGEGFVKPASVKKVQQEKGKDQREMVCINCPKGCMLTVTKEEDGTITVTGNTCRRGEEYGRTELTSPKRIVTSTIPIKGEKNAQIPVKTASPIPKEKIKDCMKALKTLKADAPVTIGDVLLENVADTGIAIVATGDYGKAGN